jgi:hypothetical protein
VKGVATVDMGVSKTGEPKVRTLPLLARAS